MHDEESEELSLVQVTCLLVLHFIPIKYQNTSKGIEVIEHEHTRICVQIDMSLIALSPQTYSVGG